METQGESSFHDWQKRFDAGDSRARNEVWNRYVRRLIGLARGMLSERMRQRVDAEDVLQSVYRSFFQRKEDGQFELTSWDDLWGLLAKITRRKCTKQHRAQKAQRRDIRRETPLEAEVDGSTMDFPVAGDDPTPQQAAELVELLEGLLSPLDEPGRNIVLLYLQGYNHDEIAKQVGRTDRTVRRILKTVRERLARQLEEDD